jgi:hypothetical protein
MGAAKSIERARALGEFRTAPLQFVGLSWK